MGERGGGRGEGRGHLPLLVGDHPETYRGSVKSKEEDYTKLCQENERYHEGHLYLYKFVDK